MVRICSKRAKDSMDSLPTPAMAEWVGKGFFGLPVMAQTMVVGL
ncbi:hypothetical protein SDC9_197965 [bioreactor metagenome]|uniref:Uncharacterized protein n=1 Tax=bioreactor metagenome TaxID=1076179 RepID=A0A645IIN1_9ZZZZ